ETGYQQILALIFGTLLSSQGTDASFVLTRRTFSGAFLRALPFSLAFLAVLRFRFYQIVFRSVFLGPAPLSGLSAFRRVRLYQILSGLIPSQGGLSSRLLGRSDE
ncbi:hypothetical protein ACFV9W_20805, partial [Streptomyces sp. NPDC059897]|uniref:hypothetical protein n=1 Tax=Streptomyces sp. NPDC059897 TaxID=3346994 RepID=UPI0036542E99